MAIIQNKSADLGNSISENYKKSISNFSKHNEDKIMEINKPPEKLQTKDLEESLNLKESVKTKINQSSVHKSSVNKDIIKEVNKNSINSKTISKPRKSLSLERNTESDTKFKQEQKLNENKEKSVRFNEIAKHNRQPSEIDTYSNIKLINICSWKQKENDCIIWWKWNWGKVN